MRRLLLVSLALAGLTSGACKDEAPSPPVAREPSSPEERLAARAVNSEAAPEDLPLADGGFARSGGLEWTVRKLTSQRTVKNEKTAVTSGDAFLSVDLVMVNVGDQPAHLDLQGVKVRSASGETFPIARDAQVIAGRRDLAFSVPPQERARAVLLFELPESALAKGFDLLIPATGGQPEEALPLR